ncbi:MAG: hypothetical protein UV54_C0005G0020 [Candidatus Beckwithbacteria bacterium GW2011_GWA2_43_10]|uniref:Uncharacterized protein n=1 Tax=Candidatus Beckwithbacteria bacterium GW2011_GWA2_43_10 TaxID=1618369 RepID=A0A0G1C499_9BACT|nr:MAG: hypothetical protein UV54_C0005G0020 [Candidatus Beckwithbacteria bacterium GW2011_GWA2_43_10]
MIYQTWQKKVGSNYYLFNRRLSANLNYAFAALSAGVRQLAEASAVPTSDSISFFVTPPGIEPALNFLFYPRSD